MTNGYADNLTIDRIDTNGNYEPNNCRWVTMLQQSNNTRANRNFEYNGEVYTLKEWANLLKINYNTLFSRIDVLGWDFKKAISEPVQEQKKTRSAGRKGRYIEYNGEIHNIAEWSNVTGIGKKTISYRIKNGYPLDKVFGKNDLRSTGCEICVKEYKKYRRSTMQAKIKSLHLENFKGVKSATYQLDGKNASAIGQNGAGKTTLFTAYMWLMVDKDSDLKSNPNIRPIDTEECTPRVEIVFNNGDFDITVAKIQKCTVKKSKTGGADTVSLSNSYEVNSVEYGERDFKKKMSEYGFDFDLFLPLSHPDVFTSQKSADMRKVLFGMASEQSDFDIALQTHDCIEAANLLKMYTFDEVKAMQNATLRKIREEYGKDGEILRAKIEGMERSKTDIDVAELELKKNALNEQITDNKAKQEDISKEFEEQQRASDGILELKFELNDLQRKANEDLEKKRREIRAEIDNVDWQLKEVRHQIRLNKQDIEAAQRSIDTNTVLINATRESWKAANEREFDENSLICSYCGQPYQEERKDRIKADFGKKREEELAFLTKRGNELKAAIDKDKAEIEQLKATLKENEDEEINLAESIKGLEKCLEEVPQSVDISDRPEVQEIQRQIAEKEAATNKGNSVEDMRKKLKGEEYYFQSQLTEVEKQLALAQKNVEIDEQIVALRKKQGEFEQNKANAEKILYQLDLVSKRKNELLTDQVNSHFKLVKFRLFDYLKNGNVVDDCEPIIDGKSLKDHSNGALRVLAKLDIVDGLQKFYGQHYPVFAEDFSLVTDNTECRIDMDCQLIKLVAEKGVKELKIEVEG